jgi:hypothetical protein
MTSKRSQSPSPSITFNRTSTTVTELDGVTGQINQHLFHPLLIPAPSGLQLGRLVQPQWDPFLFGQWLQRIQHLSAGLV